ncbi:hypothetical protein BG015_004980, partial [Linnemannia schmuckeri]
LTYLKEQDSSSAAFELSDLKLQLEKVSYENKEGAITVDSLREVNQELSKELEELKKALMEMRLAQKDSSEGDKEKKKIEKMAQMMADLDPSGEISAKEAQLRETLFKFESPAGLSVEETIAIRKEIAQSRTIIEQHEQTISELNNENASLTQKRDTLEMRLQAAELEYEELLDKTIADEEANSSIDVLETISELRTKVEAQYAAKRDQAQQEIEDLKQEVARRNEDIQKLSINVTELRRGNEELKEQIERQSNHSSSGLWEGKDMTERERDMERIRKTMAQQLADFDVMKKALMRDLQNRCEKVVELEISLDETREQYNNVLRNSNNKAQQKKMAFLERNLEQLTLVQKQLVEQNSALKKEVAISERKLVARNERIQSLESLLQVAQENLTSQNHKFETQLQAVRDRLEQARSQKSANNALNFGRIAKPLRGGVPTIDNNNTSPNTMGLFDWYPFIRRKGYKPVSLYFSVLPRISHNRFDVLANCYLVIQNAYSKKSARKRTGFWRRILSGSEHTQHESIHRRSKGGGESEHRHDTARDHTEKSIDTFEERLNNGMRIRKRHFTDIKAGLASSFYCSLTSRLEFVKYMENR